MQFLFKTVSEHIFSNFAVVKAYLWDKTLMTKRELNCSGFELIIGSVLTLVCSGWTMHALLFCNYPALLLK